MARDLEAGDAAPSFTAPSTDGTQSLENYRGEWLVLYFYPQDDTPGCTLEACDFRDASAELDAAVLGVSPDDIASHEDFRSKYSLPFPLISDPDHELARAYGAWGERNIYGKVSEGLIRSTFLIDPEGRIADAMYGVKATGHVGRVAKRLGELRG